MIRFFDTHAHLLDERFDGIREDLIANLDNEGIAYVIECGTSEMDSKQALELAQKHKKIYATAGIHPHYAKDFTKSTLETFIDLAKDKKLVAIGEIGLDYHYELSQKEAQKQVFIEQIVLAKELDLPIAIHSRDATKDTLDILKEHKKGLRGVMHCFSGTWEVAQEVLDLGLYIALGGVVTFKNAKKTVEVAKNIDISRLILETDCPYMTPEPFRGKLNMPAYVKYAAQKIADVREISIEELGESTLKNSMELFNII